MPGILRGETSWWFGFGFGFGLSVGVSVVGGHGQGERVDGPRLFEILEQVWISISSVGAGIGLVVGVFGRGRNPTPPGSAVKRGSCGGGASEGRACFVSGVGE